MATNSSKQLSSTCIHPSSAYHRDFFLLRLPTFVNGQPTEIRGPDTHPLLYSSSLDCSVSLSSVAKEASLVLAEHEVGLTHTFYDEHFPLLAIVFSPQMILNNVSKILSERKSISLQLSSAFESLFKVSNPDLFAQVKVQFELYLCSPSKEGNAETMLSSVTSSNARFYVDKLERSRLFEFPMLIDHIPAEIHEEGILVIFWCFL